MRVSLGVLKSVHGVEINFTEVKEITWNATQKMRNSKDIQFWVKHAKSQDIELPTSFSIGICESSIVYKRSMTCNNAPKDIPAQIRRIDKDLAIAYDMRYMDLFQHIYINGIPSAAMMVDWVLEKENRGFLCVQDICEMLKHVEGITEAMIIPAYLPVWAKSVSSAFIDWDGLGLRGDSYPLGSYFPLIKYADKILRDNRWEDKKTKNMYYI
jgi:hypothetical protein